MSELNELNGLRLILRSRTRRRQFHNIPERLKHLQENDQIVFQYVKANGSPANGVFHSIQTAIADVAGVCNEEGNVLALMPHLENAVFWWQQPTKNPS